jgi:hypothetical protein
MNDMNIYTLRLRGRAAEDELNAMSPIQINMTHTGPESMQLTFSTDQAGLVGLMCHLHALGFVFLALKRTEAEKGTQLCPPSKSTGANFCS